MAVIQNISNQVLFNRLLEEAKKLGLTDLQAFKKEINKLAQGKKPDEQKEEAALIDKIKNGGPSSDFYAEYDQLSTKLSQETMTISENQRYLGLVAITQQWGNERLILAIELAKIWKTTPQEVFTRLNITPRNSTI